MPNNKIQLFFRFSLVSFLLFFFSLPAAAQHIICKPIPFLDKLSINSIFNLYQDQNGYFWIATANGLERYDGYEVQEFRNDYKTPHKLSHNDVRCFTEDDQYIWAGTMNGITLIDKTNYQTHLFPTINLQSAIRELHTDREGIVWACSDNLVLRCTHQGVLNSYEFSGTPNTFYEDKQGILWLLSQDGKIYKYNREADSFVFFAALGTYNLYRMIQDNEGRYWIVTWGEGIWLFNPNAKNKTEMFKAKPLINPIRKLPERVFYDIVQDDTYGYLYALSHFRLYILKIDKDGNLEETQNTPLDNGSYPIDRYKTYSRVIKDHSGNLWFGAFDQGYTVVFDDHEVENHVLNNMKEKIGLDANIIYFNKDKEGILWCNQARYGLCLYNEQTKKTTYGIKDNQSLYSIDVFIVPSRKINAVWLAGREGRSTEFWLQSQNKMNISIIEHTDLKTITPNPGNIKQLVEDNQGNLWIGTSKHLFFRSAKTKKTRILPFKLGEINDLQPGTDGSVWVINKQKTFQFKSNPIPTFITSHSWANKALFKGEFLRKLCTDDHQHVWCTTTYGRVFSFDLTDKKIQDYTQTLGLKGDDILNILSHKDHLWVVCDKYIIRHNLKSSDNITYSVNDENIFITSFRYGASFLDAAGNLYAGGHKGYIKIGADKQQPLVKNSSNKVCITDVRSDNRSVLFSPLGEECQNTVKHIKLLPDARNIEISLTAFAYTESRRIKYAYLLEGADKKWTYLENGKHVVFFNRLDKGHYKLRIKVTDSYGKWSEEEQILLLEELPAWYETFYAYTLYIILLLTAVYIIFKRYNKRIITKNRIKMQEEFSQMKINYFTNISHELLTPLTIISCVTDAINEGKEDKEKQVSILRENVTRLKRLLQQVLDFRKVETGKMILKVRKGNLSSMIKGLVASNFQSLARRKDICLSTEIEDGIWGYADFDKLDKILFNLLSNAIKYTPEHKNIFVKMKIITKEGCRYLWLSVADEGVGIAQKDLKHIFVRFYHNQNNMEVESNGIGLALTKELITIHHGSIEVKSELGKGSDFTIEIPIDKEIYSATEMAEIIKTAPKEVIRISDTSDSENKPCILFLDDNEQLRELMISLFNKQYRIITAKDGKEGLAKLKTSNADIIICDVMMPVMDGLDFCKAVKDNEQTNHIPVIMLTAKNGTEDQVDCYNAGAESFIAKPFEMKLLQARIDNLLQTANQRQQKFRKKMEIDLSNLDYQTPDEEFLEKAIACVKEHIKESDFNTLQLADELNMSRSTLSRKIKVLTGLTPLEFIRNIKLKYACRLLKKNSFSISEVAYSIGLASPKYFTKYFKEEFGMTPTEYQNTNTETGNTSVHSQ